MLIINQQIVNDVSDFTQPTNIVQYSLIKLTNNIIGEQYVRKRRIGWDNCNNELNKQFKHQQVVYFLEEDENPTDVTDFISTGSTMLDLAISNRPNGGSCCR